MVLDALTPLVADDVLLVRKRCLIDLVEQVSHAIRFEPQRQLELVGGERFEVVGAIEVGRAVDVAGARSFEQLEVLIARDVLRALKHHVLEEVRETGAPLVFVRRPDVIPQVDRDDRQTAVLAQDDVEPVRELVLLERQPGYVTGSRGARLRTCGGWCRCLRRRRLGGTGLALGQRSRRCGGTRQRHNQADLNGSSISHVIHQWHP